VSENPTGATVSARPPPAVSAEQASLGPPPATAAWTAEIEWRSEEGRTRFCVVAIDAAGRRRPLAESAPLAWPPTDADSLSALTDALGALERGMLAAGWATLPSAGPWYAKRFAWEPPDPSPAWYCELRWAAGRLTAGFQAVVSGPDGRQSAPVAASTGSRWRLGREPDPDSRDHHARVREIGAALQAAGWERAGQGEEWYRERFVWRGTEPPPSRVDPARGGA
jgi:hypothetical protein